MAVTFVLGRAGAGKTRYCVTALLSELDKPGEERRLILLVPEQASFEMERTLATRAARGGYSRAEVLSFSRLAQRVLAAVGGERVQISAAARVMALRCAAQRMGKALRFYRAAARTNGFYAQLDRLIEELLTERVSFEQLALSARCFADRTSRRKTAEIARLYREYLEWLGPERVDPALRLAVLRKRLAELPWLREAAIWVNGFAGFTGQELATLVTLAQAARDVTITLLLDPASPAVQSPEHTPDPLHLFQRTELTYQRLVSMFAEAGVTCRQPVVLHPALLPRFANAPTLARLEAGLATPTSGRFETHRAAGKDATGEVRLLECTTHREELRQAARFIRQMIADSSGRLHFRDFAIIARDLEPFAPLIVDVLAEYDLPYFLDRRRPMRSHPLSRLSEALFEAVMEGLSVTAMTRLLRTGLLPLAPTQAEELENTVVAHAAAGLPTWQQPTWDFARDALAESWGGGRTDSRRVAKGDATLDAARLRLVAALRPLLGLAEAGEPATGAAWAGALHEVLEALGVRGRTEAWIAASRDQRGWERAETHRLAWETLCGVLSDLHEVLGDAPLRVDQVAGILGAALREQTLGLAPPTLDQVLVSAIERSRHPDIKYAWVFALNEGVFPARPPEDELLSSAERETLTEAGLPAPASRRDDAFAERLLAYIAFTRPSCGLTLSYATVGEDGAPLLPSPLLDDVRRVLPELAVRRPQAHAPPVCLTELARGYLHVRPRRAELPGQWQRCERLCARLRSVGTDAERLNWLLRGAAYRNAGQTVGNFRPSGAAGVVWSGSPSEVELYLDCPFKHYADRGLRLDPARGPKPARWDLGEAAHAILAELTRRALREPGGGRGLPDERWQALLGEALEDFGESLAPDLARRRPELAFLSRRLGAFLAEVVAVHADRWRRGRFEPLACEQAFGGERHEPGWPALELRTADGECVWLHGKIDRLDRCRVGRQTLLLVYDYKSTAKAVSGGFLTGARLQLFTYLLAVQQALAAEADTRVAGVFLAPLYPDVKVLDTQYAAAATEREQRMYLYRPRGMFTREAAALLDGRLGQDVSPVAAMKLKKDGDFDRTRSRDVVEHDEIEQRLELARRTILLAAEGIAAGQVVAAPLVEGRTLACRRCDFQPVCRFDRAFNQPRAAEAALPTLEQIEVRDKGARS